MNAYADIVEVVETNARNTNLYLEHGYRLLDVQYATKGQAGPPPDQRFYVVRFPLFILGRTAEVAHFQRPPRQEPVSEATDGHMAESVAEGDAMPYRQDPEPKPEGESQEPATNGDESDADDGKGDE